MKIVKSGIEKRFFGATTKSLRGYTIERHGELFYIVDDTTVYSVYVNTTVVLAVYRFKPTGAFLCALLHIYDGDLITKGAIVDKSGKNQDNITIKKFL